MNKKNKRAAPATQNKKPHDEDKLLEDKVKSQGNKDEDDQPTNDNTSNKRQPLQQHKNKRHPKKSVA